MALTQIQGVAISLCHFSEKFNLCFHLFNRNYLPMTSPLLFIICRACSLQILGTNQASDRETISGKSKISGLESISHLSFFMRSLRPELGSWKIGKMQIKSHKSIKLTSEEQQQAAERHLVSADAKSRTYSFQFCV